MRSNITHLVWLGKGNPVDTQQLPPLYLLAPPPFTQVLTHSLLKLCIREIWVGADCGGTDQGFTWDVHVSMWV